MARALVLLMVWAGTARAERYLHTGLDVRSDLGAHAVRLPIGYRACAWDATLVLDPMAALDAQHDLDVLGEYYVRDRYRGRCSPPAALDHRRDGRRTGSLGPPATHFVLVRDCDAVGQARRRCGVAVDLVRSQLA